MYDVVIMGAGPAGATAAALLALGDRSVILVDKAAFPRPAGQTVWLNAQATTLLERLGVKPADALGKAFTKVTFYNADLSKSASPKLDTGPGYLVDRAALDQTLIQAALTAGVELRQQWAVSDVELLEDRVELRSAEGEQIAGRMLLAAVGEGSDLITRVTRLGRAARTGRWLTQVDIKRESRAGSEDAVAVVFGLNRQGAFGIVMDSGERTAVAVSAPDSAEEATSQLLTLCQRLTQNELAPAELASQAARTSARRSPAGAALEMDSHVAKHALVVGHAGGFVSATSDEGIYPAMWSSELAVEVLNEALDSKHSQDILMQFDAKWRMAMADYLRAPNTDIQFLLPLIFSNQPMADRMAAAFFNGESI